MLSPYHYNLAHHFMHSPTLASSESTAKNKRTSVALLSARPGLYILILVCSVLGAFTYKMRGEGVFACPASGYRSNHYLAHCETTGYADYDHGALWFDLEPEARGSAANAEVLFLGSSRMQFAFSTDATSNWFAALAAPYYLLGFSYTENVLFAEPLLAALRPRAKVYVINADRFFDDSRLTPPANQILRDTDARSRYKDKQFWQSLHRSICTAVPAVCGTKPAFFRSRDNGAWELEGSTAVWNAAPKTTSDGPASEVERWDHFSALGQKFLSGLGTDRDCIFLTLAPYEGTKRAEAQAIAKALGLDLVAPNPDGLKTFDGSHLDRQSAERWSQAFFDAAGPRIRKCLDNTALGSR
jgi:hypothetical protein